MRILKVVGIAMLFAIPATAIIIGGTATWHLHLGCFGPDAIWFFAGFLFSVVAATNFIHSLRLASSELDGGYPLLGDVVQCCLFFAFAMSCFRVGGMVTSVSNRAYAWGVFGAVVSTAVLNLVLIRYLRRRG